MNDKVEIHKLDNGVTVLLDHMPQQKAASVGYFFRVGSRYEEEHENGLAHFLEHMAFKGTDKRNVRQLAIEMDDLGAASNAFTSRQGTCYYMSGVASDLLKFNDILSDMALNMSLPADELETERGAILNEIQMYAGQPDFVLNDLFHEKIFAGQAYGRTILGPPENIKSFSRDDFEAFRQKHYHAGNLVVSVAGAFDKDEILKDIAEKTKDIKKGERSICPPAEFKENVQAHAVRSQDQHVNLTLAFNSKVKLGSKEHRAEMLLARVLSGNGMSSRLFQEIREKRGLVYSVRAGNSVSRDAKMFYVDAGMSPENVTEFMDVLSEELTKIASDKPATQEELDRAMKRIEVSGAMDQGSVTGRMSSNASVYNLREEIRTHDETIKLFQEVTLDDITAAAKRLFSTKPSLVSVGPDSFPTLENNLQKLNVG